MATTFWNAPAFRFAVQLLGSRPVAPICKRHLWVPSFWTTLFSRYSQSDTSFLGDPQSGHRTARNTVKKVGYPQTRNCKTIPSTVLRTPKLNTFFGCPLPICPKNSLCRQKTQRKRQILLPKMDGGTSSKFDWCYHCRIQSRETTRGYAPWGAWRRFYPSSNEYETGYAWTTPWNARNAPWYVLFLKSYGNSTKISLFYHRPIYILSP